MTTRRGELIDLGKKQIIIEDDLCEFTNLANKIYDGIQSNEHSKDVGSVLNAMMSLLHSLFHAYGILQMEKIGRFSGFKRDLSVLESELRKLDVRFKRAELYITLLALLVLLLPVSFYTLRIEIGYLIFEGKS